MWSTKWALIRSFVQALRCGDGWTRQTPSSRSLQAGEGHRGEGSITWAPGQDAESAKEVIGFIHFQGHFPKESSELICEAGMEEIKGKGVLGAGDGRKCSGQRQVAAHTVERQHVTCTGEGKNCGSGDSEIPREEALKARSVLLFACSQAASSLDFAIRGRLYRILYSLIMSGIMNYTSIHLATWMGRVPCVRSNVLLRISIFCSCSPSPPLPSTPTPCLFV